MPAVAKPGIFPALTLTQCYQPVRLIKNVFAVISYSVIALLSTAGFAQLASLQCNVVATIWHLKISYSGRRGGK